MLHWRESSWLAERISSSQKTTLPQLVSLVQFSLVVWLVGSLLNRLKKSYILMIVCTVETQKITNN